MSNLGQGIAAIAGGVVGFFIGGPTGAAYGFQIGLLAGSALFPTQLPGVQGPRLQDQRTTTSSAGGAVPIVYGTAAVSGNVIWLGELEEVASTEEVGGKGAPSQEQTTYTYFQPIAVGLCEGPIDGILRIWENGELVFDQRQDGASSGDPPDEDKTDLEEWADAVRRITGKEAASTNYAETFTLYLGTEEQDPDPTIESVEGIGDTPAFRGLAYLVYHRRQLQEKQGLRHPNWKFEVVRNGQFQCIEIPEYSNEFLFPWGGTNLPMNPLNHHEYTVAEAGNGTGDNIVFDTLGGAMAHAQDLFSRNWSEYCGYGLAGDPGHVSMISEGFEGIPYHDPDFVYLHYNQFSFDVDKWHHVNSGDDDLVAAGGLEGSKVLMNGYFGGGMDCAIYLWNPTSPPRAGWDAQVSHGDGSYFDISRNTGIKVQRIPRPPPDPCEGEPNATVPGYCLIDGSLVKSAEWERDERPYLVLAAYVGDQMDILSYPLNPARPADHPDNTEEFWTAAYERAVAAGDLPAGYTYNADGTGGMTTYPRGQNFGYTRTTLQCTGEGDGISLAEIVTDLCQRVGLARIDVSDLQTINVPGYVIGRVMPARAAIEPLKSVGLFDIVESPPYLIFRTRGKPAVATLTEQDIGVHDEGETPGPLVLTRKLQDVELPRTVRVHYTSPSRDYEDGEQASPSRVSTKAVNDVDVELAVCLEDSQAKQLAEILWNDAWNSRWVHQFSTDQRWLALEPADPILLPIDGEVQRLRLVDVDDAIPSIRKFNACRDDDGTYVSYAEADPPERPPNEIVVFASTELILLDIPSLRDSDNDAGVYGAPRSLMPTGRWRGAAIRYSVNEGETFIDLMDVSSEAVTGKIVEPPGIGETTTWDTANEIVVDLQSGELEDRTEAEVLAGANAAAIGRHGRWQIVQFQDVEEDASVPGRYTLSKLLQGRKGTEHLVGTTVAGDRFVLISGPGIVRIPLDSTEIGLNRIYKTVTIGASANTGIEQVFATQGVALLPYSVVDIAATFDEDGNLALTWKRRGRLGQELKSGMEIPLSEAYERYVLEIVRTDTSAVVVQATVDTPLYEITYEEQLALFEARNIPVEVTIWQLSDLVGRGTPATAAFNTSPALEPVLPPIEYPSIYARVTFGGSPDGDEDVVVRGTYAPYNAPATAIDLVIPGSGKDSPDDYATALFTYLNGLGLPASANVSQPTADSVQIRAVEGDRLTLYATAAHPTVSFDYDTTYDDGDPFHDNPWIGGTYRIPLPPQNGVKQEVSIDLYQTVGAVVTPAPQTDDAYRQGGGGSLRFTIYALDFDTNQTFGVPYMGQEISLIWSVPDELSDQRGVALDDLVQNSGLPKNSLLAQYADRVQWVDDGGRTVVGITMKYGYWIGVDAFFATWTPRGTHPSGYAPATQEMVEGAARYPSGTKWMSGMSFFHFNDRTFYDSGLGNWESGQSIEVTLDGDTFSYTIDGTEATALNSSDNEAGSAFVTTMNAIYDDLEAQIETSGDFIIRKGLYTNGQYKEWRIERTIANTPVAFSGQVTGYDLTIVNEAFDEDSSP